MFFNKKTSVFDTLNHITIIVLTKIDRGNLFLNILENCLMQNAKHCKLAKYHKFVLICIENFKLNLKIKPKGLIA